MKTPFKKAISAVLRTEAKLVLLKYKPKVIAITGSVGKTSTKDAVYAVLSKVVYVRGSEKSFNSEIGLPLTILGLPNAWNNPLMWLLNAWKGFWLIVWPHTYPKWLVLEVGISQPGDMDRVVAWLRSDVVIITGIGHTPVHIEFFNSRKHLIEEKSKLIKTLRKDGLLILNADDEAVIGMKENVKNRHITYGFTEGADILASGDSISYGATGLPEGVVFRVDEAGKSLPVIIEGVFGRNHVYASLAALALVAGLKFNMLEAINALEKYEVPPGRMRLLAGIQKSLIIDDTYNSSPFACEAALKTLGGMQRSETYGIRKIAILGDMLELGRHTVQAHKDIGKIAAESLTEKKDVLILVGQRAKSIKEGALDACMQGEIFEFLTSTEAGAFMKTFIKEGDIVLIKGSQGMRMERVVSEILFDQENKAKLLPRQDPEWLIKP